MTSSEVENYPVEKTNTVNINLFIKQELSKVIDDNRFVPLEMLNEDIKKLNNIRDSYKCNDMSNVIGVIDDTLLKGAKDGVLFTGEFLIIHSMLSEPIKINYADIKVVKEEEVVVNKEKNKTEEHFYIYHNNDKTRFNLIIVKNEIVMNFLNKLVSLDRSSFKNEKLDATLLDFDENIRLAYLKILINIAYMNDNTIDTNERSAIFSYANQFKLSASKYSIEILECFNNDNNDNKQLISEIKNGVDLAIFDNIKYSFYKDIFLIILTSNDNRKEVNKLMGKKKKSSDVFTSFTELAFYKEFKKSNSYKEIIGLLNLNNDIEKVGAIEEVIVLDLMKLSGKYDDNEIEKHAKLLTAKVASIGLPIAMIYFSGSIIGFSAAGITSGLAAIGLGFGMLGGIGVLILVGLATNEIIKRVSGADDATKYQKVNLLLDAMIKKNQNTIYWIIEAINSIIEKIEELNKSDIEKEEKIAKMNAFIDKVKTFTVSSSNLSNNNLQEEAKKIYTKLSGKVSLIDLDKLNNLNPTEEIKETILNCYNKDNIIKEDLLPDDLNRLIANLTKTGYLS